MEMAQMLSNAKGHIELARKGADSVKLPQAHDGEYNRLVRQVGYNLDVARKILVQTRGLQPNDQLPQLEKMLGETESEMQIPFQEVRRYMKPESDGRFYRWNTWASQEEIKKGTYSQMVLSSQHRWGLL
jgi:hypothetical protein